jgi:hypothetical protein
MIEYRAYSLGEDGHFISHRAFVCATDGDAIVWAKQLQDGHPIELWSGKRFVIRIEKPEGPSEVSTGSRPYSDGGHAN